MMLPILGTAEGVTQEEAKHPAVALGIALQLTNILRDVGEDLKRGRIYLPLDELRQYDLTEDAKMPHEIKQWQLWDGQEWRLDVEISVEAACDVCVRLGSALDVERETSKFASNELQRMRERTKALQTELRECRSSVEDLKHII